MSKLKIIANWRSEWQKKFNVPKGYLLFRYNERYRKNLGKMLMKLDNLQNKKYELLKEKNDLQDEKYLRDLEINIEYHFKKRNLDQNALMWSLYEIEANEMNGGQTGHEDQNVTAMELYMNDLDEYGEREIINTRAINLDYYISEYRIIEVVILEDKKEISLKEFFEKKLLEDERITIRVIRGTSKLNTKEMAKWIERLFNRLAYNGVHLADSNEIENYWYQWKEYLNDNKIILHDNIMTQEEYKAFNPLCEACNVSLIDGSGHLAHIKSIGMGSNRNNDPKRNYSSNWLHLCFNCHIEKWHKQGIKKFLKLHKHLTYKVNKALSRDYESIDNIDELINRSVYV